MPILGSGEASMLWTIYSWNLRRKNSLELTGIQMSPAAFRFVVITWKELIAFGATELGTTWVLHFHQNFTGLNIQLHTLHCPWRS